MYNNLFIKLEKTDIIYDLTYPNECFSTTNVTSHIVKTGVFVKSEKTEIINELHKPLSFQTVYY